MAALFFPTVSSATISSIAIFNKYCCLPVQQKYRNAERFTNIKTTQRRLHTEQSKVFCWLTVRKHHSITLIRQQYKSEVSSKPSLFSHQSTNQAAWSLMILTWKQLKCIRLCWFNWKKHKTSKQELRQNSGSYHPNLTTAAKQSKGHYIVSLRVLLSEYSINSYIRCQRDCPISVCISVFPMCKDEH